jgi:DNA-binding SARP family transcriptional activator
MPSQCSQDRLGRRLTRRLQARSAQHAGRYGAPVRFGVLGPLDVRDDGGEPVDLGGRQPRVVLTALIEARGRPVSVDALIEAVWADRPPATAAGTLQSYISRLRRTLAGIPLELDHAGYRLDLTGHAVDLVSFEELSAVGQEELAAGRPVSARRALADALALWRGPALVELVDQGVAIAHATALEEQRLAALETRLDADLALGRHAHVVGELQGLAAEHPLREGLHARLALALYRTGRQGEALRALADARRVLRDELGLEPGPELRDLEVAILAQDPALDPPTPAVIDSAVHDHDPFVGRQRELGELLGALARADDQAQFVVLEGDPGIGKTRLAEEYAAAAASRGSLTVWARADELGARQALWPWREAVRTATGAVGRAPAIVDELLLGEAAHRSEPSTASQFELFDAVASLFEAAGTDAPAVVLLDDLQWCDPASLELLRFLVARLRRGVVVVVTVRTLEIGRRDDVTDTLASIARQPGGRRLRLDGLTHAATDQLLAAMSGAPVEAGVTARIQARADGNPFYTRELARLLDEPGHADDEVPATVRDAIRRRLGRLPTATTDLLAVAAVVGRDVDLTTVAAVAGLELGECVDRLDAAAECRMLVTDPASVTSLRFSHALLREVLIEDLTPLRRAQLHLSVAEAMEREGRDDDVEVLADHLWHAASLGVGERAADALERAASVAIGRVAYASAEVLIRRAIQLREAARPSVRTEHALLAARLRLLEVVQATRYFSGTDRELVHATQALASRLGHDAVSRELSWSEWAALSRRAEVAEASAVAERYVARWGQDPDPTVRAGAAIVDGVTAWSRGQLEHAASCLDRAVELLREAPAPTSPLEREQPLIAETFRAYCHAATGSSSPEHALAGFDELLDALPPTAVDGRHQLVLALGCRVAAVHGCWDSLDGMVGRAAELDPSEQFAFFGGQLLLYRAVTEARRGDLDLALTTFSEGRARYRAVGGRTGLPTCHAAFAEHLAAGGRVTDAAELAAGARRQLVETGELVNEVPVCIAEGLVAMAAGDATRAAMRLATAVEAAERQGAHALARRAAKLATDLGLDLAAT